MMNQSDFLQRLKKWLEEARIPYMLTGSFGSSIHGEPRATNDIDIVITATHAQLKTFLQLAQQDCYASDEAANEALRNRSMFNVIDNTTGWKADIIFLKDHPFYAEEFQRRTQCDVFGIQMYIVSPEDSILSKLVWMKETESERQFRDVIGVAIVQYQTLDFEYLKKWARELNVSDLLSKVLTYLQTIEKTDKESI